MNPTNPSNPSTSSTPSHPIAPYLAQWQAMQLLLLEESDLCAQLQIRRSTLQKWRRKGRIAYLKIERKIYYRMSDIVFYLASTPLRKSASEKESPIQNSKL